MTRTQLVAHVASRLIAAHAATLEAARDEAEVREIENNLIERAESIVARVEQRCGYISDA